MTPAPHSPARTCVGCRKPGERDALLRIVIAGDPARAVPDVRRRAGGRGVSVHARPACLEAAVRGGGLQRGLRRDPGVSAAELVQWAAGQYQRTLLALVGTALRGRKVALGAERVREAMREGEVALLIVAADAGEGQQELLQAAARLGGRCVVLGDRASLGKLAGRELLAVLAITDKRFAERIRDTAARIAELLGVPTPADGAALSLGSKWVLEAS